jgi:hypothetical protein
MMGKLIVCLVTLCMLASPVLATPTKPVPAQVDKGPARTPASQSELEQYAQREQVSEKLAKFEGGRMRNDTLITVILILVIVILILAIL